MKLNVEKTATAMIPEERKIHELIIALKNVINHKNEIEEKLITNGSTRKVETEIFRKVGYTHCNLWLLKLTILK